MTTHAAGTDELTEQLKKTALSSRDPSSDSAVELLQELVRGQAETIRILLAGLKAVQAELKSFKGEYLRTCVSDIARRNQKARTHNARLNGYGPVRLLMNGDGSLPKTSVPTYIYPIGHELDDMDEEHLDGWLDFYGIRPMQECVPERFHLERVSNANARLIIKCCTLQSYLGLRP